MIKYRWKNTPKIHQLLIELEAAKLVFSHLPSRPNLETNLRQHSLLKSAVFSARIEGFPDTLTSPKKESQNLLTAYRFIFSPKAPKKITLNFIRQLHRLTLKDLDAQAGHWRNEPWAIFDQSGNALYLAPPHEQLPQLMTEYISFINKFNDHAAIKAAVAQFIFEKIHPFADGNGRVGRLISAFILETSGLGFKGLALFEEYVDQHRQDYYFHLEPSNDCTGFVEFFLEAFVSQSQIMIEKLNSSSSGTPEDSLLPRRREILEIIRDHHQCTFDFIRRRFPAVNVKTLHYDMSQLLKAGFIRKLGSTKGVIYTFTH